MIVKSMSRKVPSFGQLLGYIDRDDDGRDFTLRHNVMGRDGDRIRAEFEANGQLLQKRKNGVYLYHEIISITRAQGLEADAQKARLYEIAQTYVDARCPDNMVYGGLHQDKEHSYHMHLMISANRAGDAKRLRLTKAQFREIQVNLERHVLERYPELEQKVAIDKRSDRGRGKEEAELERRTGQRPKREEVLSRVMAAYEQSDDKQSLLNALGRENLELYVRGKALGVIDHESGKKHRLKTLDLEMADQISLRMEGADEVLERAEPDPDLETKTAREGEKEKQATRDKKRVKERTEEQPTRERKTRERSEPERDEHSAGNETYVNSGRSADLKRKRSQQRKEAAPERDPSLCSTPESEPEQSPDAEADGQDNKAGSKGIFSAAKKLANATQRATRQAMEEARIVGDLLRSSVVKEFEANPDERPTRGERPQGRDAQDQAEQPQQPEQEQATEQEPKAARAGEQEKEADRQKAWREDIGRARDQGRNQGRDGPDMERE